MKNVYVITQTMQSCSLHEFTLGKVKFVFTSKRMANKQMDKIKELIEHGGWWRDLDGNELLGSVLSDNIYEESYCGILRDIMISTPNGLHEVFRLEEKELNSSFGME